LPRTAAATTPAWLADHPADGRLQQIYPDLLLGLQPPRGGDAAGCWAFARRGHTMPGAFIAELPKARYIGWRGFGIISQSGSLLCDLSHDEGGLPAPHSLMSHLRWPPLETHAGRVAVVATPFARNNYAHWLLDCLPRLLLLKHHSPDYTRFNALIFDHAGHPYQIDSLVRAGLRPEQIRPAHEGLHLTAEILACPSFPQTVFNNQPWALELLRQEYLPYAKKNADLPRRIFISRQNVRGGRIANFADLGPLLERHRVTIVDPAALAWSEQLSLFARAECIVGPHGAGLANLVFAPPGAKVLEIFSPSYFPAYFRELCSHRELPYYAIFGQGAVPASQEQYSEDRHAAITLDLQKMDDILGELTGG
jgi:capsular polysaccharide biosynthesis protein